MIRPKYLLAVLLTATPFASHAETTYTFASISGIKYHEDTTTLTGILVDTSTPTTVSHPGGSVGGSMTRCDMFYSQMLREPGTFTLTVTTDVVYDSYPSGPVARTILVGCSLDLQP